MGLGFFTIPFLTRDGREDSLTYELLDNSLAEKWKNLYQKCERFRGFYLPDYVLHGGGILTHEEVQEKINKSLRYLSSNFRDLWNDDFFRPLRERPANSEQDYLNLAHVFFERAWDAAGPLMDQSQEMRDSLRILNQSIHQIESFRTGNDFLLNSRFSLGEFKIGVSPEENRLFTPDRKWGMMYLNYCHIGESYLDVFLNQYPVEPVPQTQMSCDFFLSFMNQTLLPDPGPFLKWLEKICGRSVTLEELPIGYAPVARLVTKMTHEEAQDFFRSHPVMGKAITFIDPLTFRRAHPDDANELNALINSAYRGESARGGWTHEADLVDGLRTTPEELREMIGRTQEFFLLGFSDKTLVGSVHVRDEGDGLYFGMLAVNPNLQNQRVGSQLMTEVERIGREDKKTFIRISVIHLRKELIAYYERKGYSLTGMSEPFPAQYPAKLPGLLLVEMKKDIS